jgi:hypothetical protein
MRTSHFQSAGFNSVRRIQLSPPDSTQSAGSNSVRRIENDLEKIYEDQAYNRSCTNSTNGIIDID